MTAVDVTSVAAREMLAADVPAFDSVASTSAAVAACTVTEGAIWSRLKVSAVLPALALPATSVSCTLRLFEPSSPRSTAATLVRTLPDWMSLSLSVMLRRTVAPSFKLNRSPDCAVWLPGGKVTCKLTPERASDALSQPSYKDSCEVCTPTDCSCIRLGAPGAVLS